ncbi:MAG: DUF4955 domain-containing protein [Bacteroidales bacterium]|nr:DUF4955 domain-containing protein [Bacteroidales bacterium]
MRKASYILSALMALGAAVSCVDKDALNSRMDTLEARIDALQDKAATFNDNAIAARKFIREGNLLVTGYEKTQYGYSIELSDGTAVKVTFGSEAPGIVPVVGIDAQGRWIISVDGGESFTPIAGAANALSNEGATPQVRIDADRCWEISLDGGASWKPILDSAGKKISATDGSSVAGTNSFFRNVIFDEAASTVKFILLDDREVTLSILDSFYFRLPGYTVGQKVSAGDGMRFLVESSDVAQVMVKAPSGWNVVYTDECFTVMAPESGTEGERAGIDVTILSSEHFVKNVHLEFSLTLKPVGKTGLKQWDDFVEGNADNVLLDYSYAGFDHGESIPADGFGLGYKVYNVCDYGAVPNDGKSDRDAVIAAYQAAIGAGRVENPAAKAVLYFPEGEFILHTSADDDTDKSSSILMRAGEFVVKGAGVDKTTLVMQDPNLPASEALYSSPVMLELKHNSGLSEITKVTGDAPKGSFSVEVASTAGITAGSWVCLNVVNNDAAFVAQELSPYSAEAHMTNIKETGVQVYDYHQVKSVSGTTVTFTEPIMHAVEAKWNWAIMKYPHYEMVGVEDLTFRGRAKDNFVHHGTWQDDGAYKPLAMTRLTNSWLRRVRFTSVSEACTFTNCANVSAYDIEINGNRGHSSIRAQSCSRAFIGKVWDHSDGRLTGGGAFTEGAGQYHATGVSKPSIGTVLWRNFWGSDSCFEAHATQPRATLIDCCKGGWMQSRQGGDKEQVPNHLADLTIWNFESTTAWSGEWDWWKATGYYWKILPPIVVGFHGQPCSFLASQTLVDASHGTAVDPESLYEAQIRLRLGYVPAWLNSIK